MYQKPHTCTEQGRTQGGGVGGWNPPIGLSTKMYKKKYHVFSTSEPVFLQWHGLQGDLK